MTSRFSPCGLFLATVVLGSSLLAAAEPAPEPAAPAAPTISLSDAVLATLRQNAALRVSNENVEVNRGLAQQAAGAFDWDVQGGIQDKRVRTPGPGPLGGTLVAGTDQTSYSLGASKLLRNGIAISPSISAAEGSGSNPFTPAAGGSNISLSIAVPLLRGLGNDSTGAAEAAARGQIDVAVSLYRFALASQAFSTVTAYWNARAAEESLAVEREVEQRAERLLESVKVLVSGRVFPPVYQIQAEANLREKTTDRRNAELSEISARLALGAALGLTPEQMTEAPAPADPLPQVTASYDRFATAEAARAAVDSALADRADYLASKQSVVPLQILARQAQLDLKPRVDLDLSAGYQGYNPGSSLARPLYQQLTGDNVAVGLSFDWPTRNNYQRGLLYQRRAAQRQAEAQTVQLASGIAADVLSALAEVRLRAESVKSAAATVDSANRALQGQQQLLRSGESSVLDVINLENLASSAQLSLIGARAGYAIAVAHLRFSLGAIFTPASTAHRFELQALATPPSL